MELFFNNNLNANFKYISELEAIEVVVDSDNLLEVHQLKAKILDQETRLQIQAREYVELQDRIAKLNLELQNSKEHCGKCSKV